MTSNPGFKAVGFKLLGFQHSFAKPRHAAALPTQSHVRYDVASTLLELEMLTARRDLGFGGSASLRPSKTTEDYKDPTKHDFWYPPMLGLGTRM